MLLGIINGFMCDIALSGSLSERIFQCVAQNWYRMGLGVPSAASLACAQGYKQEVISISAC